jgi:hypothetical protein
MVPPLLAMFGTPIGDSLRILKALFQNTTIRPKIKVLGFPVEFTVSMSF